METSLFKYQMFLAEQIQEQAKYEACLNEAILISSGENNISNIELLQEGFADKLKDGIKKMFDMFKRMWAKFIEAMSTLIKKDKDYLEKYKDIILNKKPINADYTMYNYKDGIKKIIGTTIPAFNYNNIKDSLESREKFIEQHFSEFKPNENENLTDVAKAKFRGGGKEIKINSSQLNMTDMYNFCIDYDKMRTNMEKDAKTIDRASMDANSLIDKMVREEKIKNTNESFIWSDNKYYSHLYESYLLENETPNKEGENKDNSNNKTSNDDGKEKVANNVTREEKPTSGTTSNPNSSINGENKDIKENDVKGETAEVVKKRIEVYAKVCGEIMSAKLTITEEIYKTYMAILKTHVRDYIGKKDKSKDDDKPKDAATNHNTGENKESDEKTTEDNKSSENKEESYESMTEPKNSDNATVRIARRELKSALSTLANKERRYERTKNEKNRKKLLDEIKDIENKIDEYRETINSQTSKK